jgi:hypothetical protein
MQVCAPSLGWEGLSELKAMGNVTLVSPTVDVASLIRSAKVFVPTSACAVQPCWFIVGHAAARIGCRGCL